MNDQDSEINNYHQPKSKSKSSSYFGTSLKNEDNDERFKHEIEADEQESPMLVDDEQSGSEMPVVEEVELMDDDDDDDDDDDEEDEEEEDEEGENDFRFSFANESGLKSSSATLIDSNADIKTNGEHTSPIKQHQYQQQIDDKNTNKSMTGTVPDISPEEEEENERKRFQSELEFVQSLANPNYLNYLAQRSYFRNQTFLNYLKYLTYWKEPDYVKHVTYPQALCLLELLQHETFLKQIVNAQCAKFIDEQLLLLWFHHKRGRDWIKVNPTSIPESCEQLLRVAKESESYASPEHEHEHETTNDIRLNKSLLEQFPTIEDLFEQPAFVSLEKY